MDGDSAAPTTETAVPNEAPKRGLSLLAAEIYGDNFHGKVPEPEPTAQEQPEGEENAAPHAEENAGEQETQEPAEVEQGDDEGGEEEEVISTFQELVEQNQWDWEWVKTLKVPVNIDGETKDATFSDLVKSYRGVEAANKEREAARAAAKAAEEERQAKHIEVDRDFAVAAQVLKEAREALDAEINSSELKRLREEDPGEYAARLTDLGERQKRQEERENNLKRGYDAAIERRKQEFQRERIERLPKEREALLEKLPEWRNPEQASAFAQKAAEHLLAQGFTKDDIEAVSYDHRLLMMVHKAIRYDELQANTSAVKKKLAKVPKVMKPGSPKPESQRTQERTGKVLANHKKVGSVDSAFAALKAKRGGALQ